MTTAEGTAYAQDVRRVRSRGRLTVRPDDVANNGFLTPAGAHRLRSVIEFAPVGRELEIDLTVTRYVDPVIVGEIALAARRGVFVTLVAEIDQVAAWERSVRRALVPLAVVS